MPDLKIEGLHLRDYRAIRSLDLPADGLGWKGVFPDVVVVGGGNGSGKTTLLNYIAAALTELRDGLAGETPGGGRVDIRVAGVGLFHHFSGSADYIDSLTGNSNLDGFTPPYSGAAWPSAPAFKQATQPGGPRVLVVPSPRDLVLPHTDQKTAGIIRRPTGTFVHVWQRPKQWVDSVEALLYEARWLDLNAKEEGRPDEARNFERYAAAFSSLLPGRALAWQKGELVVEVAGSSTRHGISELSSGEKQILILLGDLLVHWTPGSIVLVDEPELHLHTSLQIRFYEALTRWRAERGGQLWLATQSTELFGHAAESSKVLLGAGSLL